MLQDKQVIVYVLKTRLKLDTKFSKLAVCLKKFFSSRQDMNGYIFHILKRNAYIQPPEEKGRNAMGMTIRILEEGGNSQIALGLFTALALFYFLNLAVKFRIVDRIEGAGQRQLSRTVIVFKHSLMLSHSSFSALLPRSKESSSLIWVAIQRCEIFFGSECFSV